VLEERKIMDNINLMEYWINSSDRDYESMKKNFEIKQYTWSLFIGHLMIEKLLKGLYAKNNTDNPYTIKSHNLLALAQKCNIDLTDEQVQKLKIITQFNISARYEDYKNEFYELCTEEYTTEQINNIEEVRTWLKELLAEK
jgi:HEPN domain-containing protein